MRLLIIEAIVILALAAIVGTALNQTRSKKLRVPLGREWQNPMTVLPKKETEEKESPAKPDRSDTVEPVGGTPELTDAPPPNTEGDQPPTASGTGATPGGEEATADSSGESDSERELVEVSAEEAFEEFEAGGAVFIDARRTKEYIAGHIEGARNLALWEGDFEEKLEAFLNREDPSAPVLVYCSGSASCEDSHQIALRLEQAGFEYIRVIRGGFPGWKKLGYPVATGPEETSE